jgi:hypothetical protein
VASKFFTFYVTLLMFQLISEGLGLLCAIVTRTATYAIILLTFLLLLLLSFTGFLVTRVRPGLRCDLMNGLNQLETDSCTAGSTSFDGTPCKTLSTTGCWITDLIKSYRVYATTGINNILGQSRAGAITVLTVV